MIGGTEIWAGMYKYVGVKHASGVSSGTPPMARREAPSEKILGREGKTNGGH